MSINPKMRLSILASAFALAAAAPAAFADAAFAEGAGTWYQDIHADPSTGAGDFSGEVHSRQVMEKKIVPSHFAGTRVESIIYP